MDEPDEEDDDPDEPDLVADPDFDDPELDDPELDESEPDEEPEPDFSVDLAAGLSEPSSDLPALPSDLPSPPEPSGFARLSLR